MLIPVLLSILQLPFSSHAQVVKVGPNGDLQAALDSVHADALVIVAGEHHGPFFVRKPVSITGAPAQLRQGRMGEAWGPALLLQGPEHGTVALRNLELGFGSVDAHVFSYLYPPVFGDGFASVRLRECKVEPSRAYGADSLLLGASALEVYDDPLIVIEDSVLRASSACPVEPLIWGPMGAPGVMAPEAHVRVLRSIVAGGAVPELSAPFPCEAALTYGGDGGPGLYVGTLRIGSSRALGGDGAPWLDSLGELCRQAPAGPGWIETGAGAR